MNQPFPQEQVDAIKQKALAFGNSWYRSVSWGWIYGELGITQGRKVRKDVRALYEETLVPELQSRWPESKDEPIRGTDAVTEGTAYPECASLDHLVWRRRSGLAPIDPPARRTHVATEEEQLRQVHIRGQGET